jgi:hypothetical protein
MRTQNRLLPSGSLNENSKRPLPEICVISLQCIYFAFSRPASEHNPFCSCLVVRSFYSQRRRKRMRRQPNPETIRVAEIDLIV